MLRLQAIATDSPGLCAIVDQDYIETIRVYYGSSQNGIQELGYNLNTREWGHYSFFSSGDAKSGVGCSMQVRDRIISTIIYFRDPTNGTLRKYSWKYSGNITDDQYNYVWPAGMYRLREICDVHIHADC